MGKNGVLMIQTDVLPDKEAECNNRYDSKHIPARLDVPGIYSVYRFIAIEGGNSNTCLFANSPVLMYEQVKPTLFPDFPAAFLS
jgi:hypothetical protein